MKNFFVVKILLYEQDAIFHHPYFGNPDSDQNDPDPQHWVHQAIVWKD